MKKNWYKSRTLQVNIVSLLAFIVQTQTGFVIPVEIQAEILAGLNMLLRFITSKGIG